MRAVGSLLLTRLRVINDGAADDLLRCFRSVSGKLCTSFNGLDNIHAFRHFAKDSVVSIQPWCRYGGEEKLGAACVTSCVGHGEDSWFVMLESESRWLTGDLPARSAGSGATMHGVLGKRAATLNHEVFNDTVEVETIVMPHVDELHEVGHGIGGAAVKEVNRYVSSTGFHENLHGRTTRRGLKRLWLVQP